MLFGMLEFQRQLVNLLFSSVAMGTEPWFHLLPIEQELYLGLNWSHQIVNKSVESCPFASRMLPRCPWARSCPNDSLGAEGVCSDGCMLRTTIIPLTFDLWPLTWTFQPRWNIEEQWFQRFFISKQAEDTEEDMIQFQQHDRWLELKSNETAQMFV